MHPPRRTQVKEPGREEGKAMTAQKQLVNEEPLMAITPTTTRGVTLSIPIGEEATVNLIPGKMLISYLGTTVELLLQKGEICPSGQVSLNYDKNGGELPEIEVQGMITHTQDNSEFTPQTEVLDTPQTEALDNPQTEVLDSQDLPLESPLIPTEDPRPVKEKSPTKKESKKGEERAVSSGPKVRRSPRLSAKKRVQYSRPGRKNPTEGAHDLFQIDFEKLTGPIDGLLVLKLAAESGAKISDKIRDELIKATGNEENLHDVNITWEEPSQDGKLPNE